MSSPRRRKPSSSPSRVPHDGGPRTVLVAVCGLSPAVLTETVWALAREKPAVIPDRVVVLTTEAGRSRIAAQLFGPDRVWQQLRAALLGPRHEDDPRLDFDETPDRLKVFHRRAGARRVPIAEVVTMDDNTAVADALVDEFWLHSSKPDTRVIASIAGGYKTMSALCLSAMQLLANPGDRVTHVLIGNGYDRAEPPFYFPEQREQNLTGPAGPLRAADAARFIQLVDVPVIPLRRWFEDLLAIKPPSYEVLLTRSAAALKAAHVADLRLEVGPVVLADARHRHFIRVNDDQIDLSPNQYAYLRFFAEHAKRGTPAFERPADAIEELAEWLEKACGREPRFHAMRENFRGERVVRGESRKPFDADDLSRRLLDLRKFLSRSSEAGRRLAALLPGKGNWRLVLDPDAIRLHGD